MAKNDHAAGASKSLNKTITEIMEFLGDDSVRAGLGKLRPFLHEKLAEFGERWFKRGFKRGHIESRRQFRETGKVPDELRYTDDREFFNGQQRSVRAKSTLKPKTAAKRMPRPSGVKAATK